MIEQTHMSSTPLSRTEYGSIRERYVIFLNKEVDGYDLAQYSVSQYPQIPSRLRVSIDVQCVYLGFLTSKHVCPKL